VADAKHRGLQGARVYSATTAAHACLLGASVAPSASQRAWDTASGVFASAAQAVDAADAPETVKTDGGQATQGAWTALGTPSPGRRCCLPAWLTIRARATSTRGDALAQVHKRVWTAYHAPSTRACSQRLRRLRAWAPTARPAGVRQRSTLDGCGKRARFRTLDAHPAAQRTSNRVDRLLQFVARALFHAPYFHGMPDAAESRVRACALLWHCCPSSPQPVRKHAGHAGPAERLNGKRYADNWREHLLVCGSMNGVEQDPQNPL
jgi:hypothetical protein